MAGVQCLYALHQYVQWHTICEMHKGISLLLLFTPASLKIINIIIIADILWSVFKKIGFQIFLFLLVPDRKME